MTGFVIGITCGCHSNHAKLRSWRSRITQGSQKQRRLENSFRLVDMFRESLRQGDMEAWKDIFHGTSEPAGAEQGYLVTVVDGNRVLRPLSDLFSEDAPDNGA